MKAVFKVQHDVLSGLKYVTSVKRKGVRVAKDQEMLVCAQNRRFSRNWKKEGGED